MQGADRALEETRQSSDTRVANGEAPDRYLVGKAKAKRRRGEIVLAKGEQAHRGAPRCSSSPSAVVSALLLSSWRTLAALPDWFWSPSGANGFPDSKPEERCCWCWVWWL